MRANPSLILSQYSELLHRFPTDWRELSGLAYTPYRYFYLSELQVQCFTKNLEINFQLTDSDCSKSCYSHCYGFYTLARATLEVFRSFSNAFQQKMSLNNLDTSEINNFRNDQRQVKKIVDIINIANNIIKHPMENGDKITWYEPGGLDSHGNVSIYEWSTIKKEHFEVLEINPLRDIKIIHDHLEKLANLYLTIFDSIKNN